MGKEEKVRKVFLDDLPRNGKRINWSECAKYKCKIKFIYDDVDGEVEIVSYNSESKKIKIKYCEYDFEMFVGHFKDCKLGKFLKKQTNEFKINIDEFNKDNNIDITIIDKKHSSRIDRNENKYNEKMYKYHCKRCGYEGWRSEGGLLKTKKCSCCTNNIIAKGINDIKTKELWMVKYLKYESDSEIYSPKSNKKIKVKCPDCGKEKEVVIYNLYKNHSIGCTCSDNIPYPERILISLLEQLNIKYKYQLTSKDKKWCENVRYDFYFVYDNSEYVIETDGAFHKNDNKMNGITICQSQENDRYKDVLAEKNNVTMVRLDCEFSNLEYIKNSILKSTLLQIFKLKEDDIDWNKCEEFALSNLCKKACEIKRDNPNMTTTDIGEIMNLSNGTIGVYLKKGSKIWDWCEYNPKSERTKSILKVGKMNSKPVEIYKNGIKLGTFASAMELSRQSKVLFGVKLGRGSIYLICSGKQCSPYKGFTFSYVNENMRKGNKS